MGQGLEIRVPLRRMETFLLLEERTLEERRTIADSEENVLEMKNVKASWATDTETVKVDGIIIIIIISSITK